MQDTDDPQLNLCQRLNRFCTVQYAADPQRQKSADLKGRYFGGSAAPITSLVPQDAGAIPGPGAGWALTFP